MSDHGWRIAVVASGDGALAAGVAVVTGVLSATGGRTGVVVLAGGRAAVLPAGAPALPASRRLAASLALRQVPARGYGRLVVARLDGDPEVASAQAGRIRAAAGDAPVITVLGTAGGAAGAADHGKVLVVPGDAPRSLVALARAEPGAEVVGIDVPVGARALALTGAPILPALRRIGARLAGDDRPDRAAQAGQALLVVLGGLLLTALLAVALGAVAMVLGHRNDQQRAADLAALAAASTMAGSFADVLQPLGDGRGGHDAPATAVDAAGALDRATYLERARAMALATARRNGARGVRVTFPDAGDGTVPLRIAVTVTDDLGTPGGRVPAGARAEAEVVPPVAASAGASPGVGQYAGPLEYRDGKPMRPDVARAHDRMAAAALADGVRLLVVSGFRSDAEQAVLFARHPDPKWVAPPGRSLHRLGTELDLGPASAYRWLARHARRFGFVQRYSWEPWHWGWSRNAGSASVGYRTGGADGGDGGAGTALPGWVPEQFRPLIVRAAQRWNVGAVLLAAQLQVESGFDPSARSRAGAQGIAQFMPATARRLGLADPWDAAAAIDAQAHLMRNLLRAFGAVPLALAAYNAGEGAVMGCRCAGPYAETRAYVARILALVLGAGDVDGLGAAQMTVRLVR